MAAARRYSPVTVERAMRRVLRLVDGYLAKQDQDKLTTDGRGLMTWGEIRHHVRSAAALRVERPRRRRRG
jgi:hypothetical protein